MSAAALRPPEGEVAGVIEVLARYLREAETQAGMDGPGGPGNAVFPLTDLRAALAHLRRLETELRTRGTRVSADEDTRRVLITASALCGYLARWAVELHPYRRPDGLFEVIETVYAATQAEWDDGVTSLPMRWFDGWLPVEQWLEATLHDNTILAEWNRPRSGHNAQIVFTSRYDTIKPEHDFIDLGALLRNAALDAWREAVRHDDFNKAFDAAEQDGRAE
jgi:hypothetical protein